MNRPNPTLAVRLAAALCLQLAAAAAAQVVLLDTFEDDTANQPPNGPEVGSYGQQSGLQYVHAGAQNQSLRSTCIKAGDGGGPTDFEWLPTPTGASRRSELSYRARVESGGSFSAANAVNHRVGLRRPGGIDQLSIFLEWGADGVWRYDGTDLGIFTFDTDYDVEWRFDFDLDEFDLSIGEVLLVDDEPIGADVEELVRFQTSCNLTSSGSHRIDDLLVRAHLIFANDFEHARQIEWSEPFFFPGEECSDPGYLAEGIDTPSSLFEANGTVDDTSCGFDDKLDRWYLYTAQCSGLVAISTCRPGTEFDTVLAAYAGCGGTELACNDDTIGALTPECDLGGANRKSTITFFAVEGITYPIRASAYMDDFSPPYTPKLEIRAECEPF